MTFDAIAAAHAIAAEAPGPDIDWCDGRCDTECDLVTAALQRAYEAGQASREAELAGVRAEAERLRAMVPRESACPYCDDDPSIDEWQEIAEYECGSCGKHITPRRVGSAWRWDPVFDDEGPTIEDQRIEALATPPTTGKQT